MAVLPRPSLRSSARKDPVPELPATDVPPRSRPTRRQSKRTRDSSLDNESNASSKRLKSSPQENNRGKGKLLKNEPIKIPIRGRKPAKKTSVTHDPDDPQLLAALKHSIPNTSVNNVHNPPPNQIRQALTAEPLPPPESPAKNDKRSLRSHDGGSRSKSELAMYFTDYEDLISIEPKTADTIRAETILYILDEQASSTNLSSPLNSPMGKPSASKGKKPTANGTTQAIVWPEETFTVLTDATRINLTAPKTAGRTSKKDPLNDDVYIKIHRKSERKEKQLRNIEKEKSMHEKTQLERLIDGLKGHDWLRVMGISGITDGEKKVYEPKRDYLIGEVKILLGKFRIWKEEEKRRKVEREAEAEAEDDEDEDEDEDADEEEDEEAQDDEDEAEEDENDDDDDDNNADEEEAEEVEVEDGGDEEEDDDQAASEGGISDGDPPDYSDIDASALQLRLEAARASQTYAKSSSTTIPRKPISKTQPTSYTQQTITSFFSKPYQRQAAIGNHRRGRSRYAFGQPLPEPEEQTFELPEDVLTEEALATSERKRRVVKRKREADEE